MQINALKDATITSSAGKVVIAAKDEILLTSGGAYIKIANGEVELGMPNICRIRCAGLTVTGPKSTKFPVPIFKEPYKQQFHFIDDNDAPYSNIPYVVKYQDGSVTFGKIDENGLTEIFITEGTEKLIVHLLQNSYGGYYE